MIDGGTLDFLKKKLLIRKISSLLMEMNPISGYFYNIFIYIESIAEIIKIF